ncbi:glycosyltransferase family 2 protein [Oxynema aestuarii]|uniref:Glycosyltransferase family 2 protein n=1 Tax=Oxynema aestuarii AP17 TaxID=2064643 RepID=A0A6H1TY85_9CYAN|nr:glycosyltransferase family 2 protein [Oxynema aestuarii]QIZ71562.1 glycosyltransferase family 2 protein [Oxynema aestuarii AP17]
MANQTIAALMTCHNRKTQTLASLDSFFTQTLPPDVRLSAYLVDDASTDGTSEAVRDRYPQTQIYRGDGNLFWNGGMRRAFEEALAGNYTYYLWLNDDTILYPDTIARLLEYAEQLEENTAAHRFVLIGSTCDPDTGNLTYGGMVRATWWHPLKFQLLPTADTLQTCHTMNGNCVLIPREIAQSVGNLDPNFVHSTGDLDYGLRVRQAGGTLWVLPGYVGTCKQNPREADVWENPNLNLWERLKKVSQPKGLPVQEWKVFAKRHAGPFWPFYWSLPYVRLVVAAVFGGKMGSQING